MRLEGNLFKPPLMEQCERCWEMTRVRYMTYLEELDLDVCPECKEELEEE